ncbi:sialidase-4 [Antrostomus carolinensis]|uniref:sialidase-4 n=1 Tax=Antrostomus carolinensis TaxID=279965 RepID=UPI000529123B|nr:sialidase-4 [Antrostomus carolinensis]
MGSRHFPARTVLFEKESSGVTYRVPALLYLPCVAKLLAFAEERLSSDDAHANLLVLRRGTVYGSYVEWEDMRVLETATLQHHRSMNPCPLYDEFTGTLFLFFITVLGRTPEAYQIVTGQNVTQVVSGYHIDCKECFGQLCKTTPHSFAFYSDDHGRGWRFGEFIPNLQTGECQLVSVDEEDGSNILYCNARSPLGFRVQALSTDDGAVFHGGQLVQRLDELPTMSTGSHHKPAKPKEAPGHLSHAGSVTVVQGDPAATSSPAAFFQAPTWVLYSHPTSSMSRVNMGVHLSTFPRDVESWTAPWVIYEGPSAYSDLAYMELPYGEASISGSSSIAFACLFENGTRSPYEQISFSMFTLHDVLQNIPLTAAAPRRDSSPPRCGKWGRRSCLIS